MGVVWQLLRGLPAYLWSGWGAAASLLLFVALWELGAGYYGPLILPDPLSTFATLKSLVASGAAWPELLTTARRALLGLLLAVAVGSSAGMLAGLSMTAAMVSRPWVTLLLGMPPIAWLVLAMLWFGMGDGTPVFTVFVACLPIVFIGALQGTRTLDLHLKDMARAYHLPWRMRVFDLYLPHVAAYLFPAWITALGSSWKVAVMAELLATSDGVGAALAVARSHLDMGASLAWIGLVVASLLLLEYGLMEPIKRELERWREAGA
ncbi:ABC transporter permease [Comamonas faecalis]|uniref:ABC transporter permease n=1 Tax=Comamonas faecalis TaxID=1387849 RepID=A0ABP7QG13_9BURK